eukprot:7616452-Pyramimonas_sp.AAC.1
MSVSALYSQWVRTVEHAVSAHRGELEPSRSRSQGPVFFRDRVLHMLDKVRSETLHGQVACWWGRVHAVFQSLCHNLIKGNGEVQRSRLAAACRALASDVPDSVHLPLASLDPVDGAWSLWQSQLMHVQDVGLPISQKLCSVAKR